LKKNVENAVKDKKQKTDTVLLDNL